MPDSSADALFSLSSLGTARGQQPQKVFESPKLSIRELPAQRVLSVRTLPKADAPQLIRQVLQPLSLTPPAKPCTLSGSDAEYCGWVEPRCWLIVSDAQLPVTAPAGAQVTDVSDRVAAFEIAGEHAREVIAAGCDPSILAVGGFTRLRFASMTTLTVARLQEQRYRVMVDVSIGATFAQWLRQTAQDIVQ